MPLLIAMPNVPRVAGHAPPWIMPSAPMPIAPSTPVSTPAPAPAPFTWTRTGRITDPRIDELSGITASHTHPGVFWVHNDSGDSARVFAIDQTGTVLATVTAPGVDAIDWEDISVGPGPARSADARPWLYMFDTGDNRMRRPSVQVYRAPEPQLSDATMSAQRIDLRFPDGRARNVEATLVDPRTGDIVLISKNTTGVAELFRASRAMVDAGGGVLEAAGSVAVGPLATGADVSPDGSRIAVRTYEAVYTWNREPNEDLAAAMQRMPVRDSTVLGRQMEAICYTADGRRLVTVSEGVGESIYMRRA